MTPAVLIWIAIVGLLASLLFSTLSYALRMMSRVRLDESLVRHDRSAALNAILAARYDLSLSSSTLRLVGNSVVIIAVAMGFHLRYADDGSPLKVFGLTLLLTVPLLLVFSVAIPQAWSKYAGEDLVASCWPLLRAALWCTWPLVRVLNIFDEVVRRLAGVSLTEADQTEAEQAQQEILQVVAEGTAEGTVDDEQRKMIEGAISFRDLQVGQIMTPRTEVIAVDVTAPLAEVRDRILKDGLSRIPVYEGTLDNVIGILYAKDLLTLLGGGGTLVPPAATDPAGAPPTLPQIDLRRLIRPPLFVPKTKPLRDLLKEFRLQHVHIAVVLDEYGGTSGLVTTEDILEEIVGDIADEYERPAPEETKRIDDRTVEVDARMNITDLNRALDLHLPEEGDYQTLGGFVIASLGMIPVKGQQLTHEGLTLTVLEAEPRRIKKLRLELPETRPSTESREQELSSEA
jgi:putative hemolysin